MDPKFGSLAIALIYAWGAFVVAGVGAALACSLLLLAPLVLIWFAEELSEFTGWTGGMGPRVDRGSPEWAIAGIGWIALIAAPLGLLLLRS